jgi:hypothetical protein
MEEVLILPLYGLKIKSLVESEIINMLIFNGYYVPN